MSSISQQPCSICGKNPRVAGRSRCRECHNASNAKSIERNKHKPCAACGKNPRTKGSYCRECHNAYQRARHAKQYAGDRKWQKKARSDNLKRHFGITTEEYSTMLERQKGVCAICGKPETRKSSSGTVQPLSIDHDHLTGQIRGLLCHECNHLLGAANDNIGVLWQAVKYLQKYAESGLN
jgi:hypothetical protein